MRLNNRTKESTFAPLNDPHAKLPAKPNTGGGLGRNRKARIVGMLEDLKHTLLIGMMKLTIIIWFIAAAAFLCVLTKAEPRCPSCMTKIGEDEELCGRCAAKRKIWRVR